VNFTCNLTSLYSTIPTLIREDAGASQPPKDGILDTSQASSNITSKTTADGPSPAPQDHMVIDDVPSVLSMTPPKYHSF
jgi:hypothetical protein